MIQVQVEYINRISFKLRNFKWLSPSEKANCSCPICGDSKKSLTKSRGYFLRKDSQFLFYCHNCGASLSFPNLLKKMDIELYNQYNLEIFKSKKMNSERKTYKPAQVKRKRTINKKIDLPLISSLNNNHQAVSYIKNRKLPEVANDYLYYCENFKSFVRNQYDPNFNGPNDERIIIPFYDANENLIYFQGRALSGNTKYRYMTVKIDENAPKIFGLDRVDFNKLTYLVEGPIDSFLIPNCIASGGSDVPTQLDKFNKNIIYIADKEPRNKEILKKLAFLIDRKYSICLIPDWVRGKDFNEFILNGMSFPQLMNIIKKNTFSGLNAKFHLKSWSVV